MAEALEKLERENKLNKIERKKEEDNVKTIKELKRKLKRRKWVEWQYKNKEESPTSSSDKIPKISISQSKDETNKNGSLEGEQSNVDSEQKMSNELPETGLRIKRRKFAMLLGYSGAKYYGMQRNPGMNTIEEELFKAMHKHKWITDESFESSQVICFQRAARTDKGVSAARQVCSIKLRK